MLHLINLNLNNDSYDFQSSAQFGINDTGCMVFFIRILNSGLNLPFTANF